MDKPILLDLFCGAGGAARGYHDAGFDVVGVDINPQPHYPYRFVQADALEYLDMADLGQFSAIHASPPCQRFSKMLNHGIGSRTKHPDLVEPIRQRLQSSGLPYAIENVEGAPLKDYIMLCGTMFPGLRVTRHRWFESNILILQPQHLKHRARVSKASRIPREGELWCPIGKFGHQDDAQRAMGIDWMQTGVNDPHEIAQAIPPAYTRHIGYFLMQAVMAERQVVA